ncbi:hypothetical protein LV716_00280 [Flagellimonas sp. HMM57]|uniref:hypothetical protein n=1 Tax=unclassified Flagellimonas TaxID=2644544 RepID=UPI0013D0434B|nr:MULTISPECIES: hypothetical protein [unclassified Flagellimonas]UII76269.1 hypothetical protein LV716_00280 [Flagellimonas sp. HMM57]
MRKIVFIIVGLLLYTNCIRNDKKNSLEQVEPKTVVDTKTAMDKKKPIAIVESKQKQNSLIDSLMVLDENRTFQEYKRNIKLFFESDLKKDNFSHKSIEGIIPISSEEYFYYYSFSYPDKDIKKFDYIDGLIVRNALMDKGNVLKLYSNMAEFVDGEYADNFF